MFFNVFLLILLVAHAEFVIHNGTCPEIKPRELDLKGLDGRWYIAGAVTDIPLEGECAMVLFSHKNYNTTDLSISWVVNNTFICYNGSVALTVDSSNNYTGDLLMVTYTDKKTEKYYFLDVNYEHYAVVFACYNSADGNTSTYEVLKLSRTSHIKDDSVAKINKVLGEYNLQDTPFLSFNNTDDMCKTNGGVELKSGSLVVAIILALSLTNKFY